VQAEPQPAAGRHEQGEQPAHHEQRQRPGAQAEQLADPRFVVRVEQAHARREQAHEERHVQQGEAERQATAPHQPVAEQALQDREHRAGGRDDGLVRRVHRLARPHVVRRRHHVVPERDAREPVREFVRQERAEADDEKQRVEAGGQDGLRCGHGMCSASAACSGVGQVASFTCRLGPRRGTMSV